MEQKDLQELRELVGFLRENGIAEFDLHRGEQHVRIKFAQAVAATVPEPLHLHHVAAAHTAPQIASAPMAAHAPTVANPVAEETLHEVKSPIVGSF